MDVNPGLATSILLIVNAILLTSSGILLWLWLSTRAGNARDARAENAAERARIRLELTIAEQTGRLSIIRELHETAIHQVTAMIARADGAKISSDASPEVAARAAGAIADMARDTLADMRRVMTLVSEGEAAAAPLQLTTASDLFRVMRDAGLVISVHEAGESFPLKPGAEIAVYRIMHEALGNSLKHGGVGTQVRVTLTWNATGLTVLIEDDGIRNARRVLDGADATLPGMSYTVEEDLAALTRRLTGAGLTEMRERAELYGGYFSVQESPGVGFAVTAVFPELRFHNGVHGVELRRS